LWVMWSPDNSVDEEMRTRPNTENPRGKKNVSATNYIYSQMIAPGKPSSYY